jgi:hypothetical protein
MAAKLDINLELKNINMRNHGFYDSLEDDVKKAFSPYILMRYVSNPQGVDPETYEFILDRVNDLVNTDHWILSKGHKGMLWKLFASCGTGMDIRYQYLKLTSKSSANNKTEKLLAEIYPAKKMEDIKLLASLMTKDDLNELFDSLGYDKKQRKEYT